MAGVAAAGSNESLLIHRERRAGTARAELDDELSEVTGHLNAQHGRLVDLTRRMIADCTWSVDGIHSPEQYLSWKTGLSPTRAREIVAIAHRADELPACVDALRRGELAIDQLVAIVKRAPAYIDSGILELGRMLTVTQIRRLLARYPFPEPPPGESADGGNRDEPDDVGTMAVPIASGDSAEVPAPDGQEHPLDRTAPLPTAGATADDRMWFGTGDDGRWRLHVETDPLTGMMLESALDEARDALFNAGNVDVTMVDALREIGQRSLDTLTSPERRDRFRTHIHLDTDGVATDSRGWSLPDAIRRYITCDGLLSPTFVADGIPISVGRTQRAIPERTRRTVVLRDQGCRVIGCTATHHLEVHHIVHWEDGGPTDTWNLVALCPHHHRVHHRGKLGISGNADDPNGLTFSCADGSVLATTGAKPKPPGAPPPPPAGGYESPLGERVLIRDVFFRKPPWFQGTYIPHAG